ncbi:MAG: cbb3-type cytochrome c oxidase subunit I [Gammaproteobacteria bacterium]
MTKLPHPLIKFLVTSAGFLFVGTVHGVLQVVRPIRAWLESIGTPNSNPGHLIDPLAHAHINIVGGVVLLGMALTYYLLPVLSGRPLYSQRLVEHTFWWTAVGISCFYLTLMTFGIWEGYLLLNDPAAVAGVHRFYPFTIATAATIMGMGFWIYFANIFITVRQLYKKPA